MACTYIVGVPLGRSATEPVTGPLGNCGLSMAGTRGDVEFGLHPLDPALHLHDDDSADIEKATFKSAHETLSM